MKKIKVQLVKSGIGRPAKHVRILEGMGLFKLGRIKELPDTPVTHGMINKVKHLVAVVE